MIINKIKHFLYEKIKIKTQLSYNYQCMKFYAKCENGKKEVRNIRPTNVEIQKIHCKTLNCEETRQLF